MSSRSLPALDALGDPRFTAEKPYRPTDVTDCSHPGRARIRIGAHYHCLSCGGVRPCTELEMLREAAEDEPAPSRLIDAAEFAEQDLFTDIEPAMWTEAAR